MKSKKKKKNEDVEEEGLKWLTMLEEAFWRELEKLWYSQLLRIGEDWGERSKP